MTRLPQRFLNSSELFPLIETEPKYLVLMEGQAHVDISDLDAGISQTLDSIEGLDLAPSDLLEQYSKALNLAFYETYTARKPEYQVYLRPGYADYLSQATTIQNLLGQRSVRRTSCFTPLEDNPLMSEGSLTTDFAHHSRNSAICNVDQAK